MSDETGKQRGYAVLAARENRGWTLEECAAVTGFSVGQITSWEHGRHCLTMASLSRLAQVYAMNHSEVVAIVMGEKPDMTAAAE
ncbi:helix-turn-helix transcriptional regulator [Asaia siamensis]